MYVISEYSRVPDKLINRVASAQLRASHPSPTHGTVSQPSRLHRESKYFFFALAIADSKFRRYDLPPTRGYVQRQRTSLDEAASSAAEKWEQSRYSTDRSDSKLIQVSRHQGSQLLLANGLGICLLTTSYPGSLRPRVNVAVLFVMFQYMPSRFLSYSHLQPRDYGQIHPEF